MTMNSTDDPTSLKEGECRLLENVVRDTGVLMVRKGMTRFETPLPQTERLIGWYKVDEGSGTTLYNSATPLDPTDKLPDLTVTAASYFWTHLPGFGSGGGSSLPGAGAYYNATPFYQTTINDSIGCFWRIDGLESNKYPFLFGMAINDQFNLETELSIGTYTTGARVDVNCFMNGENHGGFDGVAPALMYSTCVNRWMFTFSITEGGVWKTKTVLNDGTLLTGARTIAIGIQTPRDVRWIRLFYGWNASNAAYQYLFGQVSDAMYWNTVQLTLPEWAATYDYCRGRYGMATRSGW
jgi:hypothetical protein